MLLAEAASVRAGAARLLDGVSARFEPGRVALLVGPNGAGKSTLVRALSGQLRVSAGRVSYDGLDVNALAPAVLAKRRAVLSQNVPMAFPLRVWEVVMLGRHPHFAGRPRAADERVVAEVMDCFEVTPFAERDFLTLSGGEKQRVHFARVLAQIWLPVVGGSRALFLDEPLTGLDIRHQLDFMKKLGTLARREGIILVGVLHDLNLAARFADELFLLDRGVVIARGGHAEVLTREHIRAAFGVEPRIVRTDGESTLLSFE
jgi:iron complex transport system ATP-binding protein